MSYDVELAEAGTIQSIQVHVADYNLVFELDAEGEVLVKNERGDGLVKVIVTPRVLADGYVLSVEATTCSPLD